MTSPNLLEVYNLSDRRPRRGPSAPAPVLDSVSFAVAAGERVAVVGAAGSGKTRLARAVALIQPPEAGRVVLAGDDITSARGARLRAVRRTLQFVGGHPRRSLSPRLTVRDILLEPLQVHRLGTAAEQQARAAQAADAWRLNRHLLGARASALSNALCQRVALARAALLGPRLLVCDELADRLEPAAVRPLLAQVSEACRTTGAAWLWTTHDPALARDFADRVLVLEDGHLRPA